MGFREVCIGQKGASLLEPMNYSVYENFSSKIILLFLKLLENQCPKQQMRIDNKALGDNRG